MEAIIYKDPLKRMEVVRKRAKLTQSEFCRILGVSVSMYVRMLNRKRMPSLGTAFAIEERCGISIYSWRNVAMEAAARHKAKISRGKSVMSQFTAAVESSA